MNEEDRHPIYLSPHAIALIKIYSRTDYFSDLWTQEFDTIKGAFSKFDKYELSAKQFIKQLEGQQCYNFMEKLLIEIIKEMKKDSCADYHWKKTIKKIMKEIK